ncbi:unnamed protein product [Orchesella dallaii]|uniref:Uncharacterized protein n=1 Tax=Orchesella dallaii TaxID=48710 RepID=A0ABP1QF84_9HEXA
MCSPLFKTTVRLHHILFRYMVPLPIDWNSEMTSLVYTNVKSHRLAFVFLMTLDLMLSTSCVYDIIFHSLMGWRPVLDLGTSCMLLVAGLALAVALQLTAVVWQNQSGILGINQIYEFKRELCQRFARRDNQVATEVAGFLFTLACGPMPFIIMICSLSLSFDPFYFVFEDILGEPTEQTMQQIVFTFLARWRTAGLDTITIYLGVAKNHGDTRELRILGTCIEIPEKEGALHKSYVEPCNDYKKL